MPITKLSEYLSCSSNNFVIGKQSKFTFYIDKKHDNRKILVGVYVWNIKQNNYYDGPFDQLADNFINEYSSLSEYIEAAYRYTRGRIDKYGRFDKPKSGSRVAITPYNAYSELSEFDKAFEFCSENRKGRMFYACIAYDSKKIY